MHRTTSPLPSTSDRLLHAIDDASHLATILLQEVPTDPGYYLWHVANILQDSSSEVILVG